MRHINSSKNNKHGGVHKDLHTQLKVFKEYARKDEIFHKLKINRGHWETNELVDNSSSMAPREVRQTQSTDKLRHMNFSTSTTRVIRQPSMVPGENDKKKKKKELTDWYSSLMSSGLRNNGENENLLQHNNNREPIHQLKVTKYDGGKATNISMRNTSIDFHVGSSSRHENAVTKHDGENATKERENVKGILQKFRTLCDELLQEKQANRRNNMKAIIRRRVDLEAAAILAKQLVYTRERYIGHVPGIEVGDEFFYRMEMRVVCLHHPPMAGIDSTFYAGKRVAISIVVALGYYDNNLGDPDTLIYSGQGGSSRLNGHGEDQKWSHGNVALKNSINVKNPVRVIHNVSRSTKYEPLFVYQGLYQVVDYWKERGMEDKITFKFKLIRLPISH